MKALKHAAPGGLKRLSVDVEAVGDLVVSCVLPFGWRASPRATFAQTPGDEIDDAREVVVVAATPFALATGVMMRRHRRRQGLIVGRRGRQQEFVHALEAMDLRPVVDRTFALECTAEAFRLECWAGISARAVENLSAARRTDGGRG